MHEHEDGRTTEQGPRRPAAPDRPQPDGHRLVQLQGAAGHAAVTAIWGMLYGDMGQHIH